MELTPEEVAFLRQHGYAASQVFDGRGMAKLDRRRVAKEVGGELVLTNSCTSGMGNRLATRSGHCFQCNPKQKAFEEKHGKSGYVYIAGSRQAKLLKIGTTDDIADRTRTLCSERYAGFSDWRMLARVQTDKRGTFEDRTLDRLSAFAVGASIRLKESRRCSFEKAWKLYRCGRERARRRN
jgi:hypothetical protein